MSEYDENGRARANVIVPYARAVALAGALAAAASCGGAGAEDPSTNAGAAHGEAATAASPAGSKPVTSSKYTKPSEEVLKQKLTPEQYAVTQKEGTEPPFKNEFWNNHEHGIYVDVVTGEPLFSSLDKFDSGTGWPSFTRPLDEEHVTEHTDYKLLMPRTEVRSKHGDSHLGHVFEDGPAPTGMRYCINSAALRFVPVADLEKEGYAEYAKRFEAAGVSASAQQAKPVERQAKPVEQQAKPVEQQAKPVDTDKGAKP